MKNSTFQHEGDITHADILEALNAFASQMETRFQKMESEMGSMKSEMVTKTELNAILKSEFDAFKTQMVTKSYLDDKLADLRGNLTGVIQKVDKKLGTLVDILHIRQVITEKDKHQVLTLEPFT